VTGVARFVLDAVDAMSTLVKDGKWLQALIVLYSAIDTLAWSTLPDGDVSGPDFCKWVTIYMDPSKRLGCTAEDLYAARCGLLHSSSAQSRMSRQGKAAELWYATCAARVPSLQQFALHKGSTAKIVGIVPLVEAFAEGTEQFMEALAADQQLEQVVNRRISAMPAFIPSPSLTGGKA
jgi:hypothetical protein